MRSFLFALGFLSVAGMSAQACSSTDSSPSTTTPSPSSTAQINVGSLSIGPAGGVVESPAGTTMTAFLAVPAGALTTATTISVSQIASPGAGNAGAAFDLEPAGLTFAKPATLQIYLGTAYDGVTAAPNLEVAQYTNGAWRPVATTFAPATDMTGSTSAMTASITGQIVELAPTSYVDTLTDAGATMVSDDDDGGTFDAAFPVGSSPAGDASTDAGTECVQGGACSGGGNCGCVAPPPPNNHLPAGTVCCDCDDGTYTCTVSDGG